MDDEKLKQLIMELMFIDDSFVSEDSIMQCLSRIETNRKLIYLQDSLRESIKSGNIELSKSLEGELSKIVKEKNY
jgi:ribosome biogenesis protein Nip4